MSELCPDGFYHINAERMAIAECLNLLDYEGLAKKARDPSIKPKLITAYVNIIKRIARQQKRHDVLEILSFAGLIHGIHG